MSYVIEKIIVSQFIINHYENPSLDPSSTCTARTTEMKEPEATADLIATTESTTTSTKSTTTSTKSTTTSTKSTTILNEKHYNINEKYYNLNEKHYNHQRKVLQPQRKALQHQQIYCVIYCYFSSIKDAIEIFFFPDIPSDFYNLNIPKCATWNPNGTTVAGRKNGTPGSDFGSLKVPACIFIDDNNSLFVTDRDNHRIMKYNANDTNGTVVAGNFGPGNNNSQLDTPRSMGVDRYGFLIVADALNYRIQNFSNSSYATTIVKSDSTNSFGDNERFTHRHPK